ncbi:MAG: tetratricopeptide repeat protein [Gallionellaceae bacterium]|jgi:predicted negative regulator of RcsB-dependent stress response
MSSLDLQEQEQVDALKHWWAENGKWVIGAIIVALLGFAATQFWKKYQTQQSGEASKLYAEVEKQTQSNDPKRVNDAVAALVNQFSGSAYAPRAQLLAVQTNLQAKDIARAKTQLQWVIEHAKESGLQDTARLKLASILLDESNYDEAMKHLNAAHPEAFTGLFSDLKGDVLNAQGKHAEAKAAYQLALEKMDEKSMYRNLVQLKLDGLGDVK